MVQSSLLCPVDLCKCRRLLFGLPNNFAYLVVDKYHKMHISFGYIAVLHTLPSLLSLAESCQVSSGPSIPQRLPWQAPLWLSGVLPDLLDSGVWPRLSWPNDSDQKYPTLVIFRREMKCLRGQEVFIKTFLPLFFIIPYIFKSHFFLRRVLCVVTVSGLSSSSFMREIEGGFSIINDH